MQTLRNLAAGIAGLFCLASPCLAQPADLQRFDHSVLVPTDWADGDSFRVKFTDGKEVTIRLYGVDCLEIPVSSDGKLDETQARRLRDQRRYFGIGDLVRAQLAGKQAKEETQKVLSKPFTVFTAFADGRGDGKFQRFYGFVEFADGRDLGEWLVENGLARAFGVCRETPSGASRSEYAERLKDLELVAAREGRGAWALTDWARLPEERRQRRIEQAEFEQLTQPALDDLPLDINSAARDKLMLLPGIGEARANAIIERRPFSSIEELLEVPGIAQTRLEELRQYITVGKKSDK